MWSVERAEVSNGPGRMVGAEVLESMGGQQKSIKKF